MYGEWTTVLSERDLLGRTPAEQRQRLEALFTPAVFMAGRCPSKCETCRLLKRYGELWLVEKEANMVMPPGSTPNISPQALPTPGVGDQKASLSSLFTVALLKAGRDGCTCDSCKLLQRIVDEMEKQIGVTADASPG